MRLSSVRLRIGIAASVLILLAAGVATYLSGENEIHPHLLLARALELLKRGSSPETMEELRVIAAHLEQTGYSDPERPGAVEFLLGVLAFRDGSELGALAGAPQYDRAVEQLRSAESRALDDACRADLALALGVSLHELGRFGEARPYLEEAVRSGLAARSDALRRLIEVCLELNQPADLEQAVILLRAHSERLGADAPQRDRSRVLEAQALLALGRHVEARQALDAVSAQQSAAPSVQIVRARILIADRDYTAALALLGPLADSLGLDDASPRQALFLMGICAERLGDNDSALSYFERTAKKYEQSPEGLAASLRAASLFRAAGRKEEALAAYERAIRLLGPPEQYRNRWLTLDDFRAAILNAWNDWVARHDYAEAIALSESMAPVFPPAQAQELTARAQQHWAEHLDAQMASAPFAEQKQRDPERRKQWRLSAQAHAELADRLKASASYTDVLWLSAEHFRKARDYQAALRQYTAFVEASPKRLIPLALVRRGEVLLDLDQPEPALRQFERVISDFPTDPAAFEAQVLVGRCHLEQNEPAAAEQAWRAVLTSDELTPTAREWRLALFSVGRLLYHWAATDYTRATSDSESEQPKELEAAFARWRRAAEHLDEYLRRYPESAEANEARFLLARSLQMGSDQPRRKLAAADTENARLEQRRAIQELLRRAADEFQLLQSRLAEQEERGRLNELEQKLLRDSLFEVAHVHFALGLFESAIVRYNQACTRYPHDPRVLLSYLQMSSCYEQLNKPEEARSMLEQARVVSRQLPAQTFVSRSSSLGREDWEAWINWSRRWNAAAESGAFAATVE